MSDFAFRPGSYVLRGPARLKKSKTGLWSGEMSHYSGELETRGHLSKAHAKSSLETRALNKYGRVPYYLQEDE